MSDFVHRLEVRFRDCDPMGHANNAVYFTYLEQTRFSHWRSLCPSTSSGHPELVEGRPSKDSGRPDAVEGWGFGTPQLRAGMPGVILAHAECDFKRPVKYGDVLEVRLRVAELGRTSFRYEYEILDDQQRLVATATTVQVMYDYKAEKPVPIPDEVRRLLSGAPAGRHT
jgi:acyl-CoA thioester hydrolase